MGGRREESVVNFGRKVTGRDKAKEMEDAVNQTKGKVRKGSTDEAKGGGEGRREGGTKVRRRNRDLGLSIHLDELAMQK